MILCLISLESYLLEVCILNLIICKDKLVLEYIGLRRSVNLYVAINLFMGGCADLALRYTGCILPPNFDQLCSDPPKIYFFL